jgi:TM2 domain-containing membrane protein YozV
MDWLLGVAMIYMFLFGAGKIIFGQVATGLVLAAVGLVLGAVIYRDLNRRGWKVVTE